MYTTDKPSPGPDVPWWVYLVVAKVALLLIVSLFCCWKKSKQTSAEKTHSREPEANWPEGYGTKATTDDSGL